MHKVVLTSAPAVDPLTPAEAKTHLNLTGSSQDTYVGTLIKTATRAAEKYLNRVLITQSWKVYYDHWHFEMLIPFGKLQSVATVKYYNDAGNLAPLTESDFYWVVTTDEPGRIIRKYDAVFPVLQTGRPDAIEIAFTAGYGASAAAIPEDIRHGIKLLITDYYEHRGSVVLSSRERPSVIPGHVANLLHPYKLYQF